LRDPLFPSPTYLTQEPEVPSIRSPKGAAAASTKKPLGRGTPKKTAFRAADLADRERASDQADERTRMLYEIQASLKDRPLTELSSISRQLRK